MDQDVESGEMVTLDDQRGEFILDEVHPQRQTADLMVVTPNPVKLKDIAISDLNKATTKASRTKSRGATGSRKRRNICTEFKNEIVRRERLEQGTGSACPQVVAFPSLP